MNKLIASPFFSTFAFDLFLGGCRHSRGGSLWRRPAPHMPTGQAGHHTAPAARRPLRGLRTLRFTRSVPQPISLWVPNWHLPPWRIWHCMASLATSKSASAVGCHTSVVVVVLPLLGSDRGAACLGGGSNVHWSENITSLCLWPYLHHRGWPTDERINVSNECSPEPCHKEREKKRCL